MASKENTDNFVDWLMDKTLREYVRVLSVYHKFEPQNFSKRAIYYSVLKERKRVELDLISVHFTQMTQSVEDKEMFEYGKAGEQMFYIIKSSDHFYHSLAIKLLKENGLV